MGRGGVEGTALQSLEGPSDHKGHPPCRVRSSPGQNLPAAEYLEAGDPGWGAIQQKAVCLQAHLWHPKARTSAQHDTGFLCPAQDGYRVVAKAFFLSKFTPTSRPEAAPLSKPLPLQKSRLD